jgi:copper(I)-binding protein
MRPPALFAGLILGLAATAQAAPHGNVEVTAPWSRPAVAGGSGVGYLVLANRSRRPETLVKVESPAARTVEIHRASLTGGVMSMAAQDRVAVPPGGSVSFAPGGYHLMFLDLTRTLKPGDRLPATLVFANGRRLAVNFAVGTGGGPPPAAARDRTGH